MTHTINLSNSASIGSAFTSLTKGITDSKKLLERTEKFVTKLCEEGEKFAKGRAPEDTGALRGSISHSVEVNGTKVRGTVSAGTDHAAFVEFGVGVVGAGTYTGELPSIWEYNVPTKFKDETDGWWYGHTYTHGNKANPFMHDTARFMEDNAQKIADEVLK